MIRTPFQTSTLPLAALVATCACFASLPANGEPAKPDAPPAKPPEPEPPQTWTARKGGSIVGRFIGVIDDRLVIDIEGRVKKIPLQLLSDESHQLARKLGSPAGAVPPQSATPLPPLDLVPVKVYPFDMGSPAEEPGHEIDEPCHKVKLTRDFLIKRTEVTWDEWNAVLEFAGRYGYVISSGSNGHNSGDAKGHPVVGVSWWDSIKWCNLYSQIRNRNPVYYGSPKFEKESIIIDGTPARVYANWDSNGFRLPTEAEWEFACRQNSERSFHSGQIKETGSKPLDRSLKRAGWYGGNSDGCTHPVAGKDANSLELHDMHGNAAEWCWDAYRQISVREEITFDPRGPDSGDRRVIRGGSWNDTAADCRAAARYCKTPGFSPNQTVGFRPVMNGT